MRTNCPNCGAVVDPDANRCAYCGTPYIEKTSTRRSKIRVTADAIEFIMDDEVFANFGVKKAAEEE